MIYGLSDIKNRQWHLMVILKYLIVKGNNRGLRYLITKCCEECLYFRESTISDKRLKKIV
jgi:hypothetical protein